MNDNFMNFYHFLSASSLFFSYFSYGNTSNYHLSFNFSSIHQVFLCVCMYDVCVCGFVESNIRYILCTISIKLKLSF